jgi:ABC-type glycerol-3-phosphate transport system substrate-binding protein
MKKLIFIFTLISCVFLYACGKESPEPETTALPTPTAGSVPPEVWTVGGEVSAPPAEASPQVDVLTVTLSYYGGEAERDALSDEVLSKFGLAVKLLPYPVDYASLLTMLASESAPDLIKLVLSPARLAELTSGGYIREIPDALIERTSYLKDYIQTNPPAQAYRQIYGAYAYLPCAYDKSPAYAADGTRFLYRKDWAATLNLAPPRNPGELYEMAKAFAAQQNPNRDEGTPLIGLAIDSAARFASLYGCDPSGWSFQNGRYIPTNCVDTMLPMLYYARKLYDEGLLVFTAEGANRVSLNDAGILAARADNSVALKLLLEPVAESLDVSIEETLVNNVAMMDIPGEERAWENHYATEGWLVSRPVTTGVLERLTEFLDYTLSEEARTYSRYGLPGVTYTENEHGLFMFTDPETYAAYDLNAMFPTGGFLNLLIDDVSHDVDIRMPSADSYSLRRFIDEGTTRYYIREDASDMLCRGVNSPLRDGYEIDYESYFYEIITGTESVDVMFQQFRDTCRQAGLDSLIEEVNRLLPQSAS